MSIVQPVVARLVDPAMADRLVTAMSETPGPADADHLSRTTRPTSYVDMAPALYVYRQCRDGAVHTGVVCEIAIRAFLDRRVRGHEAVDPDRVAGLVRHHAETTGPPALVALLHQPGPAFAAALGAVEPTPPLLDFPGPDARQQRVWRVPDGPVATTLTRELAAADLYVADGHHRVAAALEEWQQAGMPPDATVLCVVHPIDDLRLSAFHRRLTGPVDHGGLLALLSPQLAVRSVLGPPAPTPGAFGLYVAGAWWELRRQAPGPEGAAGLDVTALQELVLDRLVDRGSSYRVEIAAARAPIADLVERCDVDGGALFTLAPPPLGAITRLADRGEVMPPKTTYFEPKPCSGIFLRR